MRVGVVDPDRCRPEKCAPPTHKVPCIRYCPLVRSGAEAIILDEDVNKARIIENVCTGCGICIKKCPFSAIRIANIAEELKSDFVHRFDLGGFVLFRLPVVKPGKIIGLIGPNGSGKTTAIKILAGETQPNLGHPEEPPEWNEIIRNFRGSELQNYFKKLSENQIKLVHKPQYVTKIPDITKGVLSDLLEKVNERGIINELKESLNLKEFWDRDLKVLSGGELQRTAIAAVIARDADVYFFDEPSSFLDIKERLEVTKVLHQLATLGKTVIIVEHDLIICDYLSDYVHILYGQPGVYGIVSHIHGVREGINLYLDGFLPDENIRFRTEPIRFHLNPLGLGGWESTEVITNYNKMEIQLGDFYLKINEGVIHKGEIVGIVGKNGLGKSTFIKLLGNELTPDVGDPLENELKIAIKPQYLDIEFDGTVEMLLRESAGKNYDTSIYKSQILKPFNLTELEERYIKELSGGELQKLAIANTLSKEADLYLFDEPSAYLDSYARLTITKTIKRFIENKKAAAFIVEHDILAVDFLSDSLIVFSGESGKKGFSTPPIDLKSGMNLFLKNVNITFRRDPRTGRPRVNKLNSELDRKQKRAGDYYYISLKSEE
ncbi:MAG: ribosome biogenesis/translation initiation ATPase RLI [Candidatus Helarchaeota archaeon]|nr:ribosome biogenesis/translation initiation ATPase RLI [Candidatus Helarchaeota archaeon]